MASPPDLNRPTPQSVSRYVKRNAARVRKALAAMEHSGPAVSVREADHQGHHIVIRTTYEIRVDRMPLMQHVVVTDEGQVQCHALPNYTFASAIDLVKSLIDQFPEDFKRGGRRPRPMPGMQSAPGHLHKTRAPRRRSKSKTPVQRKVQKSVHNRRTATRTVKRPARGKQK